MAEALDPLALLLSYARERENMRQRRLAPDLYQPPWSADPILAKYRFCNVRRWDDRVSRWLLKHYYPAFPSGDVWFAAAVARLVNWPPTLQHLLDAGVIPQTAEEFFPEAFAEALEAYHREHPAKTYTGAYMLYAGGRGPFKGVIKSAFIAHHLLKGLYENRGPIRRALSRMEGKPYLSNVVKALQGCFGISSFMAGQIAADLTYLPDQLGLAPDLLTYAPQGPGSLRGLNRVKGLKLTAPWKQEDFDRELVALHGLLTGPGCLACDRFSLTLHDVQNVLCEYDKYARALYGEGKPRSHYTPETAYNV